MPEQYRPKKGRGLRLSEAHDLGKLMLVTCGHCFSKRYYFPGDLRRLLGNKEIDDISIKCEGCGHRADVTGVHLAGQERAGLRVRKLVAIKIKEVPVWKDQPL